MRYTVVKILLYGMTFSILALPFSSPLVTYIKMSFILPLFSLSVLALYEERQWRHFIGPVVFIAFLSFAAFFSWFHGRTTAYLIVSDFKDFVSLALVSSSVVWLSRTDKIKAHDFLRPVLFSLTVVSLLKVLLIFVFSVKNSLSPYDQFFLPVANKFGLKFVGCSMDGGLFRIQFSHDVAIPFLLYIVFTSYEKFKLPQKFLSYFVVPILILSVFFAYSRYLYALAGLVLFISFIERTRTINMLRSLAFSIFILLALYGPGHVVDSFFARTSLTAAPQIVSDAPRRTQYIALLSEFEKYPFWGKGMGTYVPAIIRDEQLKYSYELQVLAICMRFGIIGVLVLGSALYLFFRNCVQSPDAIGVDWRVLVLFFAWCGSGFTNPYLVSSFAGIVFLLFCFMSRQVSEKAEV